MCTTVFARARGAGSSSVARVTTLRTPTRDDFLLDPDLVFLNHGSYGAVPRPVFDAFVDLQRQMERNPVEWLGRRSDEMLAAARARLGGFVGAAADDLVFVPNPTTGINIVTHSLALAPGDEVVTTDHEYGAMDRTWRKRCAETGATYVRVPIPLPVGDVAEFVERVWAAVTPRTRILFLSHITSATALVFPVDELCRRARAAGILTIIDGAHVPAHLPLDVEALACDVYTGALHKWLCTPKGSSFLWVRRDVQPMLEPLVVSWGWESDAPGPSRFVDHHEWQGTRDLSAFLATSAAIDFVESHDWAAMQATARRLALDTRRRVDELTGLQPISPDEPWIGQMAAIRLPDHVDVVALQATLFERHRIEVPLHRWSGIPLLRVSFAGHSAPSDADALVGALSEELPLTR